MRGSRSPANRRTRSPITRCCGVSRSGSSCMPMSPGRPIHHPTGTRAPGSRLDLLAARGEADGRRPVRRAACAPRLVRAASRMVGSPGPWASGARVRSRSRRKPGSSTAEASGAGVIGAWRGRRGCRRPGTPRSRFGCGWRDTPRDTTIWPQMPPSVLPGPGSTRSSGASSRRMTRTLEAKPIGRRQLQAERVVAQGAGIGRPWGPAHAPAVDQRGAWGGPAQVRERCARRLRDVCHERRVIWPVQRQAQRVEPLADRQRREAFGAGTPRRRHRRQARRIRPGRCSGSAVHRPRRIAPAHRPPLRQDRRSDASRHRSAGRSPVPPNRRPATAAPAAGSSPGPAGRRRRRRVPRSPPARCTSPASCRRGQPAGGRVRPSRHRATSPAG